MSTLGKHIHLLVVVIPLYQELYRVKQSVMPIVKDKCHGLKMFCLITKHESGISDPTTTWNLTCNLELHTSTKHCAFSQPYHMPQSLHLPEPCPILMSHFILKQQDQSLVLRMQSVVIFLCRWHQKVQKQKQCFHSCHSQLLNNCSKSLTQLYSKIISLFIINKITNPFLEQTKEIPAQFSFHLVFF